MPEAARLTNYTVADLLQIAAAFVLFLPLLFVPGYVFGWATNAIGFRGRTLGVKLLVATPLSICVTPILIFWGGLLGPMRFCWIGFALLSLIFTVLFAVDLSMQGRRSNPRGKFAIGAVTGWLALGLASLTDFHWNGRLYFATSVFDISFRTAFVDAISRTGIPPADPFFYPGHPIPVRYHYFWFLPSSLVDILGGGRIGPYQALTAATLWCGLGLMSLVVLYAWFFGSFPQRSVRRAKTGIVLLLVTGLDIIPLLIILAVFRAVEFSVDAWNEQISGWVNSLFWVPHHVASAIACLTGLLALWHGFSQRPAYRASSIVLAGAGFACSVGLSVYVSFVFAAALAAFCVVAVWKRWWREGAGIACSGALAAIFAFPYLHGLWVVLQGPSVGGAAPPASSFIAFTVRMFQIPEGILTKLGVPWLAVKAVDLALLPLNYGIELGLLLLVAVAQLRRYRRRRRDLSPVEWVQVTLVIVPAFICTFFRSTSIQDNDLGWRGFLIPQFILLLWAIDYVRAAMRARMWQAPPIFAGAGLLRLRNLVLIAVAAGMFTTLYGLVIDRAYLPILDAGWINTENPWFVTPDRRTGARSLALRDTYEWVRATLPRASPLLQDPEYQDFHYALYANRQALAFNLGCGTALGSIAECQSVLDRVRPLFAEASGSPDRLDEVCRKFSISGVVVKDTDAVWKDSANWIWKRQPAYSTQFSRVFTCQTSQP